MSAEVQLAESDTPLLTRDEAAECLQHIRDSAAITWQWVTKAYLGRAWLALGYETWDAMCDAELGGMRLRLPREERREIVGTLREQGMSTRAIGAALGTSEGTVRNDLSGAKSYAPISGLDGKRYEPRPRPSVNTETGEIIDAEIVDDPSPRVRAPRTDVVAVVNLALSRARDAARAADQITAEHLRHRNDEAAVWGRDLAKSIESLVGLARRLGEETR